MDDSFGGFYCGKTVLVTGDTGFKGSWLAIWLKHLGADVVGYALEPPTEPSNFAASRLNEKIKHVHGDVRDHALLAKTFHECAPQIIFHLAAQPLVRLSYEQPRMTFEVNLMGTVNVLEAARQTPSVQSFVAITTDKCYRNVEWEWAYRETDTLGGYDPYSASKGCAELAIAVYQDARFQGAADPPCDLAVASARAGNVIGGGDWACDRIVPDAIRAITSNSQIVLRNPDAMRPWQHVLEPLSAYLWLGARLATDSSCRTSWNIGPAEDAAFTVEQMVKAILQGWPAPMTQVAIRRDESRPESFMLRLDCGKANLRLGWRSALGMEETLDAVVAWYKCFYSKPEEDMYGFCVRQIEEYTEAARRKGIAWPGAKERRLAKVDS